MTDKETILIFQEPKLYFFPHYSDITFQPYDISERSLSYIFYKILYICRLPICSYFWGSWKKHISTASQVIIFDYGYQRGMEKYIHKINPQCKVYLFIWNKVDAFHKNHTIFSDKKAMYSTDTGDCQKYHFKYNHIFYPIEYFIPYSKEYQNRLFFLGADKNRGPFLKELNNILVQCGLDCDIRVVTKNKDAHYLEEMGSLITKTRLSYEQYLDEIRHCGIILDIVQAEQKALTMRVLESVYLSRKLITNNPDIANYDFYDPNNIYILPDILDESLILSIQEFIAKPFHAYSKTILKQYDFHHWLASFDS